MRFVSTLMMVLLLAVPALAADVDGKWVGVVASPGGEIPVSFTFKADGDKLTGSTSSPDGMEIAIKDGKIEGSNITFVVALDFGGMPFVMNYKGVVSPEQIKLTADIFGQALEMVVKKDAPKK